MKKTETKKRNWWKLIVLKLVIIFLFLFQIGFVGIPKVYGTSQVIDIGLQKEVDTLGPYHVGDRVTFRLIATNYGPNVADASNGIKVFDDKMANGSAFFGDVNSSPSGGWSGPDGKWQIGALDVGETATKLLTATILQSGPICNDIRYEFSAQSEAQDPNSHNDIAEVCINVVSGAPVLNITKGDNPDPVQAGATLTYTIEYWNSGNADATGVVITETYNSNVTFVSATPSPSTGNNVWNIGTLSPSAHQTITITVTVKSPLANGTVIHNVVSIDSEETDPVQDTEDTTVVSTVASAVVSKTPDSQTLEYGENIIWTVSVTNNGTISLNNLSIVDILPNNIRYTGTISVTLTGTGTRTSIVNPTINSTGTISWGVWTLNPGNILVIRFSANVTAAATTGTYINTSFATSTGFTTPPDTASVTLVVTPPPPPPPTPPPPPPTPTPTPSPLPPEVPEFTFVKEGPAEAYWGDTVTYTIHFTNIGGDTTNVIVKDYLPAQAEFVDASPVYVYDKNSRTITWKFDEFKNEDEENLWLKVTLKGECGADAVNKATLEAENLGEILESKVTTKVLCIQAYHQNFFSGYPDKTYKPERSISRAEVASSVGRALGLPYLELGTDVSSPTFPDVPATFWGFGNIEVAYKEKLVIGYPDGTYGPDRFITRAEVAMVFFRLLGIQPVYSSKPTFSDIDSSHWAYGAIEAIAKKGIITGYPNGTFKPDQHITRAEYVTIACKSLFRRGPFKDGEINNPYPDVKPTHWAYEYIMEASIPHVVVNPERLDVLIVIPSKKIRIYTEGPNSTIVVPNIGDIVQNVIVPVDGLTPEGQDPPPREVTVKIIVKGGLP